MSGVHPLDLPRSHSHGWWRWLLSPAAAGVCGAAAAASLACLDHGKGLANALRLPLLDRAIGHQRWLTLEAKLRPALQNRLLVGLLGLSGGYAGYHLCDWLRWKVLRALLGYQGWMYSPRSSRTKLWALCVKLLEGPGPHDLWKFQSVIPHQPLPELDDTLDRWLGASAVWMPAEDHEATKAAVEHFRRNEGPQLQQFLSNKAAKSDSWLADYWMTAAYLSSRESLAVTSSFYLACGHPETNGPIDQMYMAASWIRAYALADMYIDNAEAFSDQILGIVPLCMNGYKTAFGMTRVPGAHVDTLEKSRSKHVVVIRKGHYFKLDLYSLSLDKSHMSLFTLHELMVQLELICQQAEDFEDMPRLATLTSQERHVWAKHRELLAEENSASLRTVESAMLMFVLDDKAPVSRQDYVRRTIHSSGNEQWFDKAITCISYPDGRIGQCVEHTPFDATIFLSLVEFCSFHERRYKEDKASMRILSPPQHLVWNMTGLKDIIRIAAATFDQIGDDLDIFGYKAPYSKQFMKRQKISPDGYIQMVMQYAYYRLHGTIPKTYEPATGRLFYLGRTETIHPGSALSSQWIQSMENPACSNTERQKLFRAAVKQQTAFRLDATAGKGCDRHLLGLYCASREMGMDVPAIFTDKAWQMPFQLSTSQTPTRIFEFDYKFNYDWAFGGFKPASHDGYGISYIILGDEELNISVCSWRRSSTSDTAKMVKAIEASMEDLKQILQ